MIEPPKWLPDASGTQWEPLGAAMRAGRPVPAGYIVVRHNSEEEIRAAYEQLKLREKTHFVAVRGSTHSILNVLGSDALIHAVKRFRTESPGAPLLVQRMINAMWCGKTQWHRKNLRIKANEGMMLLDPDVYLVNSAAGKCLRRSLAPKQRKMIRCVDGAAKVIEPNGERAGIPAEHLTKIAELAVQLDADFTWAIDDVERLWLISV